MISDIVLSRRAHSVQDVKENLKGNQTKSSHIQWSVTGDKQVLLIKGKETKSSHIQWSVTGHKQVMLINTMYCAITM